MQPDDDIMVGRALDESHECLERMQGERAGDLVFVRAEFELHGATLRSLAKWYPDEARVEAAVREWECLASKA
jgi:hypothetical protein